MHVPFQILGCGPLAPSAHGRAPLDNLVHRATQGSLCIKANGRYTSQCTTQNFHAPKASIPKPNRCSFGGTTRLRPRGGRPARDSHCFHPHISSSDGSSMMSLSGSSTYGASFSPVGSNGGGTVVPPVAAGGAAGSAVASQPLFHEATPATKPQISSQICVRKRRRYGRGRCGQRLMRAASSGR